MINRRRFLTGLGGAAVAAGAGGALLANPPRGGAAAATPASGPGARADTLPASIVNETGWFSDGQVLVYILGTNIDTEEPCRAPAAGDTARVTASHSPDRRHTDCATPP